MLTSIFCNVDERELGDLANWESKRQRTVFAFLHALFEIAHEITRQVKGSRNANFLNVILNVGLCLKMRNVRKTTVRKFTNVQQRGEDQVLDTDVLGSICNIFSLTELNLVLCAFPVVGHEEDSVGSLQGLGDGGFVAQVSLIVVSRIRNTPQSYVLSSSRHLSQPGLWPQAWRHHE